MQTYRKIISDIVSDLKAYNLDDRFSYRFILSKIIDSAEYFFSQDVDTRRILKSNDIYKTIPNFTLCQVNYGDSELELNIPIQRSINKVPATFNTNYGNLIKFLNSVNSTEYKLTQFNSYYNLLRREYSSSKIKYCWIEDDYLYIPDSAIPFVKVLGVFKDSQFIDYLNGKIGKDYKPLDSVLNLPDMKIKIVKDDAVQRLAGITKRMAVDENPNGNTNLKN